MTLLQIKIDEHLNDAIRQKAQIYGVPASTLVRIVLVKSFLGNNKKVLIKKGNIFNSDRDNQGKGLNIDDFIAAL